jgi:protein TonB
MFALSESGRVPRRRGEWTSRTLSLAIHAALITAAVVATKQVVHDVRPPIVELPLWWPTPAPAAPVPCISCYLPGRPFPTTFSVPIPDPTMTDPPPIGANPAPGAPTDLGSPSTPFPPGSPQSPGLPLESRVVDEPPEMISHPEPHYPEVLRQAGIEGRVLVEAVLDTTGRAEAGSLRIISASHPLFATEAEQVVLASRYRPGRMAGRVVRVRVLVPISFGIRR